MVTYIYSEYKKKKYAKIIFNLYNNNPKKIINNTFNNKVFRKTKFLY